MAKILKMTERGGGGGDGGGVSVSPLYNSRRLVPIKKCPRYYNIATNTGGLDLLLGLCTVWSDITHTIIGYRGRVESRILSQPQLNYNVNSTVVGG